MFTIFVSPTRAHSARIWRTVASFATSETRPFWIVSCTSADSVVTANSQATTPMVAVFMVRFQYTPRLFLPEVVDHLRQDFVELKRRLVPDESLDAREVGDAPRHILESRLIRVVVGHELDRGIRTAELAHPLGQRHDRDFLLVPDVNHLPDGFGLRHELQQRPDDVGDVGE